MSVRRAYDHIDAMRLRAESLDEPLRSELVATAVTLGNMMACIAPRPAADATYCARCDNRPCTCGGMVKPGPYIVGEWLDDGFGNVWPKCGEGCRMEIVRPGKVQCECDGCPGTST